MMSWELIQGAPDGRLLGLHVVAQAEVLAAKELKLSNRAAQKVSVEPATTVLAFKISTAT